MPQLSFNKYCDSRRALADHIAGRRQRHLAEIHGAVPVRPTRTVSQGGTTHLSSNSQETKMTTTLPKVGLTRYRLDGFRAALSEQRALRIDS